MDLLVEMELLESRWETSASHTNLKPVQRITQFDNNLLDVQFAENVLILIHCLVSSCRESEVTPVLLALLELPVPPVPLDLSDPSASRETEERV